MRKILTLFLALTLLICALPDAGAAGAGTVALTSGKLNVRAKASAASDVVTTLENGSYITLISKSGAWWRVEYAPDSYGWCSASYIAEKPATAASVNISYGSLNVRQGAGTGYAKVASLERGDNVMVLSASNGWSRILYDGVKTGYVSSAYLKSAESYSGYGAVSLNVPSFKQTDSRWANVTIGSSGKTMSKIGCATTAVAMMESYRTGTVIYPNTMAKRLSYTASGNIYWPSNYRAVTSSASYLSGIYDKLKQGKPVLFGAKTSAGKQHWVVIYGYSGGSSLSAAGFKINDPGSSSRTTLQQFLNAYPIFYKYFYY